MWQRAELQNVRRKQDEGAVGCLIWVSGKPYMGLNDELVYPHSNVLLRSGKCAQVRVACVELLAEFKEEPPEMVTSISLGVDA
jgi:hypothetical protein